MKTIRLISVLFLTTTILCFTACGDDDPINEDGQNGKQVTKIIHEYDGDEVRTETFAYTNGKVTRYKAEYGGKYGYIEFDQIISYSGNTVTLKGVFNGDECEQTYHLNNEGLATTCKIAYKDNTDSWEENYLFQYSDGYLTGMSCTYSDGRNNDTRVYNFSYSNGNLTKATYNDGWDTENRAYTYTTNINKGYMMNEFLLSDSDLGAHRPAFFSGLLGKTTTNLVKSNGNENFVYSLDDDGYIKTAISSNNKFTYSFE